VLLLWEKAELQPMPMTRPHALIDFLRTNFGWTLDEWLPGELEF